LWRPLSSAGFVRVTSKHDVFVAVIRPLQKLAIEN